MAAISAIVLQLVAEIAPAPCMMNAGMRMRVGVTAMVALTWCGCSGTERTTAEAAQGDHPLDAGGDRRVVDARAPDVGTSVDATAALPAPDAIARLDPCSGATEDPAFAQMAAAGDLGLVSAVWGLADDDMYVALESTGYPPSAAVLAHWDGAAWTTAQLPMVSVAAISGTPSGPWVLGRSATNADDVWTVARDAQPDGGWHGGPIGYPWAFDIAMLGPAQGLIAASPTFSVGQGVILRSSGEVWLPMPSPDLGSPYTITRLRELDPAHVYGIGQSTLGNADVLASFDGARWTAIRVPPGAAFLAGGPETGTLQDVVAGSPASIYALAVSGVDDEWTQRIYRVSPDLTTWSQVAESTVAGMHGPTASLVATRDGAIVASIEREVSPGPPSLVLTTAREGEGVTLCEIQSGRALWSAPGSPNVHVFAGDAIGAGSAEMRHVIVRIDP